MKSFRRLTLTAVLAVPALLATGCSGNNFQAAADPSTAAAPASSSAAATSAAPSAPASNWPAGMIPKGLANDGKGDYLQTSIADSDPAMRYNPAITDDAAKAHYSEADLADAQKVIVKFIAEEAIDSTLNGGGTDVDGWWAAHKDQIHPDSQAIMLKDMKSEQDVVDRERWIATTPGYSYLHGATTPRIKSRTITPSKLAYVESSTMQGVYLETKANWSMDVTSGSTSGVQRTSAEISISAAKDPADGKWKIAGYNTNYQTGRG